jgi:dienelactone hydrolase
MQHRTKLFEEGKRCHDTNYAEQGWSLCSSARSFMRSQGAKRVILLGSSMGADISLIAATETQVAGVIALSPEYLFGLSDTDIRAISVPKLFINSEGDAFASDDQQMFQRLCIKCQADSHSAWYSRKEEGKGKGIS